MRSIDKLRCVCVMILGVLFVTAGISVAQQEQSPLPSVQHEKSSASDIVAKMKEKLNLTDEQVSQITLIIQNEIEQRQVIMKQNNSQMEALRKDTESKLSQYLTPDQLAQWKNNQRQHLPQEGHNRTKPSNSDN